MKNQTKQEKQVTVSSSTNPALKFRLEFSGGMWRVVMLENDKYVYQFIGNPTMYFNRSDVLDQLKLMQKVPTSQPAKKSFLNKVLKGSSVF